MRKVLVSAAAVVVLLALMGCTPSKAKVSITDTGFDPAKVTVRAGGTVEWTNRGSNAHAVMVKDANIDSGGVYQGQNFKQKFDEPGTHAYFCRFHINETGVVEVR